MYQIFSSLLDHFQFFMHFFFTFMEHFLDASTHLYKRVCPSVGPPVGPSVGPSVGPERLLSDAYYAHLMPGIRACYFFEQGRDLHLQNHQETLMTWPHTTLPEAQYTGEMLNKAFSKPLEFSQV